MNIELAPQFIQDIDWELLKEQKKDIIELINDYEIESKLAWSKEKHTTGAKFKKQAETLTGVLHIIDGMQDYAVDICDVNEDKVFDKL